MHTDMIWLPVDRLFCVQKFEDGLPVHLGGDVGSSHIQHGRRQVNVQHYVGVAAGEEDR